MSARSSFRIIVAAVAAAIIAIPGAGVLAAPSRFAARVVAWNHPGGQMAGAPENMLGGPRGGGMSAGATHTWSLGVDTTGGDDAFATLGFDCLIVDGPGADFIVFENAYLLGADEAQSFAELVFVEVSSDGATFARFPVTSATPAPIPAFGVLDPAVVSGFAGVRPALANVVDNPVAPSPFDPRDPLALASGDASAGGDSFDLRVLADHPTILAGDVDLHAIRYVRLVDVYGDGSRLDREGRPIYDATSPSNAADIDAVAVINYREEAPPAWGGFGRDAAGNGFVPIEAAIRLPGAADWVSAPLGFLPGSGLVLFVDAANSRMLVIGAAGEGAARGAAADTIRLRALDAATGALVWSSDPHDAGDALLFDSVSTPAVDPGAGAALLAAGGSAFAVDASTGAALWSVPVDAGGDAQVINGSLHVADGLAYLATYGGFLPAGKRLTALHVANGSVAWSVQDGGPGSEAPTIFDWEGTRTVATLRPRGLAAYDADSGAPLWSHDAPLDGEAWQTDAPFFGGLAYRDGALYAATYPFSGPGEVVCVHAATGRLLWRNAASVAAGGTPLVHGATVWVAGHGDQWGDPSYLVGLRTTDGAEIARSLIAPSSSAWNTTPVGTLDSLAMTGGPSDIFPDATGLLILSARLGGVVGGVRDAAPGTPEIELPAGTPTLGTDGSIIVILQNGAAAAWLPGNAASAPASALILR